ncbi:polysaccharide pyruvyl transferase family protein [Calothrix sp. PCC 6303]|uniref:polysaccharide pyruvyl transferase family protein n=1 Tax=Calothrix sp. PCC 6303 TaxID=1170562 RepID=UPI0002A037BE|nr:polysaccharide pyruvyl transferase family protein [Calothrix sp. PCC 6303]AFZ01179.1 hypothetical protein Cal6303_2157 [Calothrix sp. PCC 6303]
MKAAIWGSYNYGNYGDDIMALQFATYLKKLGAEPYVYGLDNNLAKKYEINTTDSWDELFDGSKFCLIGGGGVLVNNLTKNVDEEFQELYLRSIKHNCPVFPISIGGQGLGENAILSQTRLEFFSGDACQTPTVRLTEDVELFQKFGKQSIFYPDVLLSVADYWNIIPRTKPNEQIQVGINLPASFQANLLVNQLRFISQVRKDIVFHFVPTYLPNSSINWELSPKHNSPFIKNHIYTDPKNTMEFLRSLDLIISYKLHLGLTALALGVPFFSVGGPGKAKQFLKSIDAEFAIFPSNAKVSRLFRFLSRPSNVRNVRNQFDFNSIAKLREASWGHMKRIDEIVAQFR